MGIFKVILEDCIKKRNTTIKLLAVMILLPLLIVLWGFFKSAQNNNPKIIYSAGIVNHHLLAKDIIEKFFEELSRFQYDNIIILSPDHFGMCSVYGNSFIFEKDSKFAINNDHGITSIMPMIKKNWPKAHLIPVLVCNGKESFPSDILNKKNTLVIASVDFSHYLPENLMNLHDDKSISNIVNFESGVDIDVDCPWCVKIVKDFAKKNGATNILEVGRSNSFKYLDSDNPKDGTSYYSVIFSKSSTGFKKNKTETFLFVGDIMLARGVRDRIEKNGFNALLVNVKEAFRGVDYIVGNLEGPIIQDAPNVPHDSLQFFFDSDSVGFLKRHNFNILSLANNHTDNYKKEVGFGSTVSLLAEKNIATFGHYNSCDIKYGYNDKNNYFLAFNLVGGDYGCSNIVLENIKKIKKQNKNSFVILYPHWGKEYQATSGYMQKSLARKFIDQGADLIIGSHPHVIQDIEVYKNKLIFYSLGNFIFDQYFSRETQVGLMVGLSKKESILSYYLIPFKSDKSVVNFLSNSEADALLKKISEKSSKELTLMIEKGTIELKR